jgi:NADPH2:quinone reductase
MKNTRIVITALGSPSVLKPIQEDLPQPGAGEVGIKILATGVAFADVLMRYGLYPNTPPLPFTPGYDVVGVIEKLGDGVSGFTVGQTVAALTKWGGYSQFINLPVSELTSVPAGLDPAEAVSLVLNYVTAWQMLHRLAQLQPGQSVLIHGAAGGVGTAALELGRLAGLVTYGTASRAKHDLVIGLGGKPIDYKNEDFVSRVLECTAARVWMRCSIPLAVQIGGARTRYYACVVVGPAGSSSAMEYPLPLPRASPANWLEQPASPC